MPAGLKIALRLSPVEGLKTKKNDLSVHKQMENSNMKIKMILVALAVTSCGKPTATSSIKDDTGPSQLSLCATYVASEDLTELKSVNPFTETVSNLEKAMIQTVVLINNTSTPVTPDEAVDIFSDRDNRGTLGGTVTYFKINHYGREKTLANVSFYPGDNEYGALFQIWAYGHGDRSAASMIGTIEDSDIYCLTPAN